MLNSTRHIKRLSRRVVRVFNSTTTPLPGTVSATLAYNTMIATGHTTAGSSPAMSYMIHGTGKWGSCPPPSAGLHRRMTIILTQLGRMAFSIRAPLPNGRYLGTGTWLQVRSFDIDSSADLDGYVVSSPEA